MPKTEVICESMNSSTHAAGVASGSAHLKHCSICKNKKSLDSFHKNRCNGDGLQRTCKACFSSLYQKNVEKRSKQREAWRKSHPEAHTLHSTRWQRRNPAKARAKAAKHDLAKLQRTPPWLTETHFQQIEIFYDAAVRLTKEFGVAMDVDHIIPLQGENVSGLHVPWNLQVLPAAENRSKSNKITLRNS